MCTKPPVKNVIFVDNEPSCQSRYKIVATH